MDKIPSIICRHIPAWQRMDKRIFIFLTINENLSLPAAVGGDVPILFKLLHLLVVQYDVADPKLHFPHATENLCEHAVSNQSFLARLVYDGLFTVPDCNVRTVCVGVERAVGIASGYPLCCRVYDI